VRENNALVIHSPSPVAADFLISFSPDLWDIVNLLYKVSCTNYVIEHFVIHTLNLIQNVG